MQLDDFDTRQLTKKGKDQEYGLYYYTVVQAAMNFFFDDHRRKERILNVILHDGEVKMRFIEFLYSLILWRFNVFLREPIRMSDVYKLRPMTPANYGVIMDAIVEKFEEKYGQDRVAEIMSQCLEQIAELSRGYSSIVANTFSIWDVAELEERSPVFKQLVNTQLDERLETKVHEEFLEAARGVLKKALQDDGQSALLPYFESKRIDITQGGQMFIAVGPRPNVDKKVLPKPIKGNFLRGLQSISEYYIEAVSARDALITKHKNVRESGYLSRKMNLLCLDTEIDYRPMKGDPHGIHFDCGTTHLLTYLVGDKHALNAIVGKYYRDDKGKLRSVREDETSLIGKTIELRTHIKCAHPESGKVCPTCFGGNARRVRGTRIGALPAIKVANPISQKAMSAKHKTGTNSVKITSEIIKKYFEIQNQDLFLREEYANRNDLFFGIKEEDFGTETENTDYSDETLDAVSIISSVYVFDGENEYVMENEDVSLTISHFVLENNLSDFVNDREEGMVLIPAKALDSDEPVFSMTLVSQEITRYLMEVTRIIDGSKTKNYFQIEDLIVDCMKILNEAGIFVRLTHMETLFYNMVRFAHDETIRPDFSREAIPYTILSMSRAIYKKDVCTGLAFDRLRDRFEDISTYRKTSRGIFDPFFRVKLFQD